MTALSNPTQRIGQKVWNFAHVLRDDGVSNRDYLEQLTYLLFLKMADEREKDEGRTIVPADVGWESLARLHGEALERQYFHILTELPKKGGMLQTIYLGAQNKIQNPARLRRLVELIGSESWLSLDVDVKGAVYEELLRRNAEDVRSGTGEYFTPRPIIRAMVKVMRPQPGETIADPACGTGGFLLATHEYLSRLPLDKNQKQRLRDGTLYGFDIVREVVRLCAMNLFLHGVGADDSPPVKQGDSLAQHPGQYFDMVLTNPPFGTKGAFAGFNEEGKAVREAQAYSRTDFWTSTRNKQLNFVQHIRTILKPEGRTAVVLPDNVLFEGGAGETIRRKLLHEFDVHTLVRLPTGIWYSPGVKANILFFDKRPPRSEPWTTKLWVYDFRTNQHFTLKQKPLTDDHLEDFVTCYNADDRHKRAKTERFRCFTLEDILRRDNANLDITWLKDESLSGSDVKLEPDDLARDIADNLLAAYEEFSSIHEELQAK